MSFEKTVQAMWFGYRSLSSPKTISHAIVNAPFVNPPRVRCLSCGNRVVPEKLNVRSPDSAIYCPCCNAGIENVVIDDIFVKGIDCVTRMKQLGYRF